MKNKGAHLEMLHERSGSLWLIRQGGETIQGVGLLWSLSSSFHSVLVRPPVACEE
jgi:hypothetical protein